MATDAATGDVGNPSIRVMLFGLLLVVAAIAVHIRVCAIVAAAAISIGITMVHWEGMIVNAYRRPCIGVMALRALSCPVSCWSVVAGLAIRLTLMVEISGLPGIGVVAKGALPAEVSCWSVVAGLAVGESLVAEVGLAPGAGVVAVRALPREMVRRAVVAGLAVGESLVAEV